MKKVFASPVTSRVVGALGAGLTWYFMGNSWQSAAMQAVGFAVYGAAHSTATKATAGAAQPDAPKAP